MVSGPLKHFLSASNLQCMQMKTEMVPAGHPLYSLHTKHISVCSYQIKYLIILIKYFPSNGLLTPSVGVCGPL